MAAGRCKAAYHTDEYHGYGCSITEGPCMFLYPDSKACAEKYGEGPDAEQVEENEIEDGLIKYECRDCEKQFIVGNAAAENLPDGFPVCPYCGRGNVEATVWANAGDIEDMGCMSIWTNIQED